jgi:hypothetical protein
MIVFVESNFGLELALRQPDAKAAEQILELAELKKILLTVPAFSLVEPYHKLHRERKERRALHEGLVRQVGQMARSADFAELRQQSNALLAALANKSDIDASEFEKTISRIMKCAEVLPTTREVIAAASARQLVDLESHDALVFASIEGHLMAKGETESIFATRDAKGFLSRSVTERLAELGCKVIPDFSGAAALLMKRVGDASKTS